MTATKDRRLRICVIAIVTGTAVSLLLTGPMLLTGVAPWFPPFWPGLFFAWAVIIATHRELWAHGILILATIGNAAFYTFVILKLLQAEARARGRLSRILLIDRAEF